MALANGCKVLWVGTRTVLNENIINANNYNEKNGGEKNGAAKNRLEISLAIENAEALRVVLGLGDESRRLIEREWPVAIAVRGDDLVVSGPDEAARVVADLLGQLLEVAAAGLRGGRGLLPADIKYLVQQAKNTARPDEASPTSLSGAAASSGAAVSSGDARPITARALLGDTLVTTERGKPIGPRTAGQKTYVDALRRNDMVFVIGPAGTGKTYLAVAAAVEALKAKKVARILLTRPAVEAGERLGFLPGDLEAKVDPYLRPLYDALYEMFDMEKAQKMFERRVIEIAPLAYMRGRTLNEAFVILDEAQNTTPAQMKMFLTRLGFGSKMVVTGDVTQTDLPNHQESGLRVAERVLPGVEGLEFVRLGKEDVVRHSLVQRIIEAYETEEMRDYASSAPPRDRFSR